MSTLRPLLVTLDALLILIGVVPGQEQAEGHLVAINGVDSG